MQNNHIYFGPLDVQERQRIQEERQLDSDTVSLASQSTKISISSQSVKQSQNQLHSGQVFPQPGVHTQINRNNVEVIEMSEESLEAKRRHEEILKKYELQKTARKIHVPINDKEVKLRLREMGHPICFFGEGPADRRERLKQQVAKYLMEKGELPSFITAAIGQQQKKPTIDGNKDEENEYFLYNGPPELKQARTVITQYSLRKAAYRIENSKLRRDNVDPLEEEDQIDNEARNASKFQVFMSQFADSSAVSRGNFSSDYEHFASAGGSGECKIWSVPECRLQTQCLGHLTKVHDICFHPEAMMGLSPDVCCNLATASSDINIRLWSLNYEKELQTSIILKGHEDRVNRILFHQTGKYLFSTSHDTTWRFWDLETQKEIMAQTGHTRSVYALALHPDGSLLYTGDFTGIGALWDLRIGKMVLQLHGHVKNILCADISQNGYQMVSGGDDNTLRVWDLRRKNCIQIIPAHLKLISDVKFSPDNSRFLVSVSYDNSLKIWNAKDWSLVKAILAHESKITSVSLSYDSKYMATTSLDRKWMLWKRD